MGDTATHIIEHRLETGDNNPDARPDIPHPPAPRWQLGVRAHVLRNLAQIGFSLQNKYNGAPSPARTVWIDSTLSKRDARAQAIRLDIYEPSSLAAAGSGARPVVINFHGGGYTLGHGTDDALWAKAVVKTGAVVVSVSYRLAPQYPFPTPVEDSADAILWVAQHAAELGIDPSRIVLSGFSSGANIVLSAFFILRSAKWNDIPPIEFNIIGMILFYPTLDWSIPRWVKRKRCPRPDLTLSTSITDLTDASHLYPNPDEYRTDPRLSPGIAPDDMLQALPPVYLCLCEHDMLLQEGEDFAARLEGLGLEHMVRVVQGEKHAFDKPPPVGFKAVTGKEYGAAVQSIKGWLDA